MSDYYYKLGQIKKIIIINYKMGTNFYCSMGRFHYNVGISYKIGRYSLQHLGGGGPT